jgi:hypothetical protein
MPISVISCLPGMHSKRRQNATTLTAENSSYPLHRPTNQAEQPCRRRSGRRSRSSVQDQAATGSSRRLEPKAPLRPQSLGFHDTHVPGFVPARPEADDTDGSLQPTAAATQRQAQLRVVLSIRPWASAHEAQYSEPTLSHSAEVPRRPLAPWKRWPQASALSTHATSMAAPDPAQLARGEAQTMQPQHRRATPRLSGRCPWGQGAAWARSNAPLLYAASVREGASALDSECRYSRAFPQRCRAPHTPCRMACSTTRHEASDE